MIANFNETPGLNVSGSMANYSGTISPQPPGHRFSVNVASGEVYSYHSSNLSPFLSEGQTNLINVYWHQHDGYYSLSANQENRGLAGTTAIQVIYNYFFNFLAKDPSPVHVYARAVTANLPIGASQSPLNLGQGNDYNFAVTAGPAGAAISTSFFRNPAHEIVSCRIVARPLERHLSTPAFDIPATVITSAEVVINQISSSVTVVGEAGGIFGFDSKVPRATFVVTNFHPDFLEQAAERLRGGDTTPITLRAQIQTVVSPLASPFNPNFAGVATTPFWIWPSVVTLLSDHFPLVYRHPVTRSAYYGV